MLKVRGVEVDSKNEQATGLFSHFRAIRAFQGTAIASPDYFYESGLRPLVLENFSVIVLQGEAILSFCKCSLFIFDQRCGKRAR